MRRSFLLLMLAALLVTASPMAAGATGSAQGTGIYVVRLGDTLSNIAARHCSSAQELFSLNSGILWNPNQIYPGMQLRVINRCGGNPGGYPGGNWGGGGVCDRGPMPHAQGTVWGGRYVVARGDTSYSIATRFGLTVTALCQANGINPWYIFPGQTLVIPGYTGACGQCGPGGWNCPPTNCQPGWNCPPTNCQPGWNCPPTNCQPGWNCPPTNCQPGWNCALTPIPLPTIIPLTPQPPQSNIITFPTGACVVGVAAGRPFYSTAGGQALGNFQFAANYTATRGVRTQGGQQWYEIGPVPTTTVPVWAPASSVTGTTGGCIWPAN